MNCDIDVEALVTKLGTDLSDFIQENEIERPLMVGIHTGGVWIAEKLHQQLALAAPLGSLDISFYRDDFTRIGLHPQVKPSNLPTTIENRDIILVDDVLHTGRTIRAALNEIFDYGRPQSVTLVVLIERDRRELPICAQIVGKMMTFQNGEHIKLTNDGCLTLKLLKS